MRRWLAILLLALLPFQFSWAAMATYCGHESGQAAQHLGHHEHQHAAQVSDGHDGESLDQGATGGLHFDCSHCHGACVNVPPVAVYMAPIILASHAAAAVEDVMRTLAQSPPERPQWLLLA